MRVLGIETSCDETAIGIVDSEQGIIGEAVNCQIDIHRKYGGVFPEIAARDHVRKLIPTVENSLHNCCTLEEIDAIAYTSGPGLAGALLVGAVSGYTLAWALGKPALGIHHMEAHLLAPDLTNDALPYPFLALLVSGGHTMLVGVRGLGHYTILGQTMDDAVGEAFDKIARVLGLPYPGGPEIERLGKHGDPNRFPFPRPMARQENYNFSFSGLKTHVARTYQASASKDMQTKADIACCFERAAVQTLMLKCRRAIRDLRFKRLLVAGGVSANARLRKCILDLIDEGIEVSLPHLSHCTDNGTMIAYVGMLRLMQGQPPSSTPYIHTHWPLDTLLPPRNLHRPFPKTLPT